MSALELIASNKPVQPIVRSRHPVALGYLSRSKDLTDSKLLKSSGASGAIRKKD